MIGQNRRLADIGPLFTKRGWLVRLIATTIVLLLMIANAHLVYVAVTSQPDCVVHFNTDAEASGSFRAAKSDC
jgi:hypothetical protein